MSEERTICQVILQFERPFKISQLYEALAKKGIYNKVLILKVLNQLYENGLVEYSDVVNDIVEYQPV